MKRKGAYAKGIAKREEILSTALHVIASRGFHDTSVREIAEAVGLTPAGVLYHFDSKDELFEAILRKRDEHDDAVSGELSAVWALRKVVEHNPSVPGLVQIDL